jgi:hypothetical protein
VIGTAVTLRCKHKDRTSARHENQSWALVRFFTSSSSRLGQLGRKEKYRDPDVQLAVAAPIDYIDMYAAEGEGEGQQQPPLTQQQLDALIVREEMTRAWVRYAALRWCSCCCCDHCCCCCCCYTRLTAGCAALADGAGAAAAVCVCSSGGLHRQRLRSRHGRVPRGAPARLSTTRDAHGARPPPPPLLSHH